MNEIEKKLKNFRFNLCDKISLERHKFFSERK